MVLLMDVGPCIFETNLAWVNYFVETIEASDNFGVGLESLDLYGSTFPLFRLPHCLEWIPLLGVLYDISYLEVSFGVRFGVYSMGV